MKRRKFMKRIITMLLLPTLLLQTGLLSGPIMARAEGEGVEYVERHWDETDKVVVETTASRENPTTVTDQTTWSGTTGEESWYVVNDNVTINSRITVTGTVNLILCDGKTLTAPKGITVQDDDRDLTNGSRNVLNIYGQSEGSGKLYAGTTDGTDKTAESGCAGIGGGNQGAGGSITINGGSITINGGMVTATGGVDGAGIGGGGSQYGDSGAGGSITINGGTVTATGGVAGAGIGGGLEGAGGEITIYGGMVTATGGDGGAGIGGGYNGAGGTITINGGSVTATGGVAGAGIGGGLEGAGGEITIGGGTVTATGGEKGAGIGGGWSGAGGTITILGGHVTATGGEGAVGIGAGEAGSPHNSLKIGPNVSVFDANESSSITTSDPDSEGNRTVNDRAWKMEVKGPITYMSWDAGQGKLVPASTGSNTYTIVINQTDWNNTASNSGWYIVSSDVTIPSRVTVTGTVNLILCDGATLTAPKGITVQDDNDDVTDGSPNVLNIYGQSGGSGKLYAGTTDGTDINYAGIGGGYNGAGGSITISGGTVTATGGTFAAGIGGGNGGAGGSITINGGTVTATGGQDGAGIGGGCYGAGGTITISSGRVTATGGLSGAGIGGGYLGGGGEITINGGTVEARGIDGGAGIGGGCGTTENNSAGGTITINGGTVTATGSDGEYNDGDGAGIGGGCYGAGGTITINGGTVTASGAVDGAGIGGGYCGAGGTITINGGTVTATGGVCGAGIGGGCGTTEINSAGGEITIGGGTVTVTGGMFAAGIGGGNLGAGGEITIDGGTVTATSGGLGAGIGSGYDNNDQGTLTLGTHVYAFASAAEAPDTSRGPLAMDNQRKVTGNRARYMAAAVRYSVTFDENGHGEKPPVLYVAPDTKASEPDDLSEDGWTFGGWFKEAGCQNAWDFAADEVMEDTILYAKWTEVVTPPSPTYYTVRFDMNGHGKDIAAKRIRSGEKLTKPDDPVDEAYDFIGWYTDQECTKEYDFNKKVTRSFTLFAKWTEKASDSFTVSFDMQKHGEQIPAQSIPAGTPAEKPADPAAEGFSFGGWYTSPECLPEELYDFATPVTADITLYAKWTEKVLPVFRSALDPVPLIEADTTELYLVKGQKFIIGKDWSVKKDDKTSKALVSISKKSGQLKAKKDGTATIWNGERSLVLHISAPSVPKKLALQITADGAESRAIELKNPDELPVYWFSATPDVAAVDQDGNVTAVSAGKAKVTAYINGSAYKCTVSVKEAVPAKERTLHMAVGATKSMSIKGVKNPLWSSADEEIASFDKKKLTANKAGETTLSATAADGTEYKVHLYVEDISLTGDGLTAAKGKNKYTLKLKAGESTELSFASVDQAVVFKSSKPDSAFIDENGKVSARSAGKSKFTAKVDRKSITINVIVE